MSDDKTQRGGWEKRGIFDELAVCGRRDGLRFGAPVVSLSTHSIAVGAESFWRWEVRLHGSRWATGETQTCQEARREALQCGLDAVHAAERDLQALLAAEVAETARRGMDRRPAEARDQISPGAQVAASMAR